MRASIAYLFALASAVLALNPTDDFDAITVPASVDAGSTVKVTWTVGNPKYTGPVTISLIGGASQPKLVTLSTIATDVDNSALSYEWKVDSSLGTEALYGLTFVLNSDKTILQYSNPFTIKASSSGGGSGTNTTGGGSTDSASSTSTSVVSTTSTSQSTSTSVTVITSTPSSSVPYGNSTTTGPSQTTNSQTTTRTTSTTAATNTGGAAHLGAGSLALAGGLAMAVLAF